MFLKKWLPAWEWAICLKKMSLHPQPPSGEWGFIGTMLESRCTRDWLDRSNVTSQQLSNSSQVLINKSKDPSADLNFAFTNWYKKFPCSSIIVIFMHAWSLMFPMARFALEWTQRFPNLTGKHLVGTIYDTMMFLIHIDICVYIVILGFITIRLSGDRQLMLGNINLITYLSSNIMTYAA